MRGSTEGQTAPTRPDVVHLKSKDGQCFPMDNAMLALCPTARHVVDGRRTSFTNTLGGSTFEIQQDLLLLKKEGRVLATLERPSPSVLMIVLPDITTAALQRVVEYCAFQSSENASNGKSRRAWEAEFVHAEMEQGILCELASAAYYLDIKGLVNLTSKVIASQISGKSAEQLQAQYKLGDVCVDSLLEPERRLQVHRRAHMQRALDRRKSQASNQADAAMRPSPKEDERSLDDLLSFIENDTADSSEGKRKKKKKKKKPKRGFQPPSASQPAAVEPVDAPVEQPVVNPEPATPTSTPQQELAPNALPASTSTSPQLQATASARPESTPTAAAHDDEAPEPNASLSRRRELAKEKLLRLSSEEIVWGNSEDEEDDSELDLEIEGFKKRLEAINALAWAAVEQ